MYSALNQNKKCRVINCTSVDNKASKISFFRFPSDEAVAKKWVEFCRRDDPFPLSASWICMKHFAEEDIENLVQYNMGFAKARILRRGAVPTMHEPDVLAVKSNSKSKIDGDEFMKSYDNRKMCLVGRGAKKRKRRCSASNGGKEELQVCTDAFNVFNDDDALNKASGDVTSPTLAALNEATDDAMSCAPSYDATSSDPIVLLKEAIIDDATTIAAAYDVTSTAPVVLNESTNDASETQEILYEIPIKRKKENQPLTSHTPNITYIEGNLQIVAPTDYCPVNEGYSSSTSQNKLQNPQQVDDLQAEVEKLKKENEMLRRHNDQQCKRSNLETEAIETRLKSMTEEMKNMEEKLKFIFSKHQLEIIKTKGKKQNWTDQDIAKSITLYAISSKTYRIMFKQGFPLPKVCELKAWVKKLKIYPGLIRPAFTLLTGATHMTEAQKVCVLSLGEMNIRQSDDFILPDSTQASNNYVQVVTLRGLMSTWQQPVYYNFDCKMTADLLKQILWKSKCCGFNVVAVVCNLESINKLLFNELDVSEQKPWFISMHQKVYVFADVPHLLKSMQYHFFNEGFLINERPVRKEIISHLLSCTSAELLVADNISARNLGMTMPHCNNVETATKLFSPTVTQAITRAASLGHFQGRIWVECYQLFKITNEWFDLFNIRKPHDNLGKSCQAYGLAIKEQDKILDKMSALMMSMKVIGESSSLLLPFQKGIIQTNNALKLLLADMKSRFNFNYILTYRLNQFAIENMFKAIRTKGDRLVRYLDQEEFQARLRLYLLGRIKCAVPSFDHLNDNDTPDKEITQPPLTGIFLQNLSSESEPWPVEETEYEGIEYDDMQNLPEYECPILNDISDMSSD